MADETTKKIGLKGSPQAGTLVRTERIDQYKPKVLVSIRNWSNLIKVYIGETPEGEKRLFFEVPADLAKEKSFTDKLHDYTDNFQTFFDKRVLRIKAIVYNPEAFYIIWQAPDFASIRDIVENKPVISKVDQAVLASQLCSLLKVMRGKNLVNYSILPELLFWDQFNRIQLGGFFLHELKDYLEIENNDEFLAPELQEFLPNIDYSADVYSVGTLLHFLSCKKAPESMDNQMSASPLKEIANHCMRVSPSSRPRFSELEEDLKNFIRHETEAEANSDSNIPTFQPKSKIIGDEENTPPVKGSKPQVIPAHEDTLTENTIDKPRAVRPDIKVEAMDATRISPAAGSHASKESNGGKKLFVFAASLILAAIGICFYLFAPQNSLQKTDPIVAQILSQKGEERFKEADKLIRLNNNNLANLSSLEKIYFETGSKDLIDKKTSLLVKALGQNDLAKANQLLLEINRLTHPFDRLPKRLTNFKAESVLRINFPNQNDSLEE